MKKTVSASIAFLTVFLITHCFAADFDLKNTLSSVSRVGAMTITNPVGTAQKGLNFGLRTLGIQNTSLGIGRTMGVLGGIGNGIQLQFSNSYNNICKNISTSFSNFVMQIPKINMPQINFNNTAILNTKTLAIADATTIKMPALGNFTKSGFTTTKINSSLIKK